MAAAKQVAWDAQGARLMVSGRDNVVHTWAATGNGEWDCLDKINDHTSSNEPPSYSEMNAAFHSRRNPEYYL